MNISAKAVRYYSPSQKSYVLNTKKLPEDCIREKYTGYTDRIGIPIFEGDIIWDSILIGRDWDDCYHVIEKDPDTGMMIARFSSKYGKHERYSIKHGYGYATLGQDWTDIKAVVGNIHDCKRRLPELRAEGSESDFEFLVPDIKICRKIMEQDADEFKDCTFVWTYNPFEARWKLCRRTSVKSKNKVVIIPAPSAEEIMKKLPETWDDVDLDKMNHFFNPGIITEDTCFELRVEKSCECICSHYTVRMPHGGIHGFAEEVVDSGQMATGLLGAWFFMKRNRNQHLFTIG